MNYSYKPLQKEDHPFIKKVLPSSVEDWFFNSSTYKFTQIIYNNKEQIGIIQLLTEEDTINISVLAVLQKERNKRHGSKILTDIKNAHPNKTINVMIDETDRLAIAFYQSNGFIKISSHHIKNTIQHKYQQITIVPYKDHNLKDLKTLSVDTKSTAYVSSPENILYKHLKNKENTSLKLFYLNNELIGLILIRQNDEYNNFFIWQLLIDNQYQNKNIGSIITKQIIKQLKTTYSTYSITTTVINDNERSKHFFTKLGFVIHSKELNEPETNYIL